MFRSRRDVPMEQVRSILTRPEPQLPEPDPDEVWPPVSAEQNSADDDAAAQGRGRHRSVEGAGTVLSLPRPLVGALTRPAWMAVAGMVVVLVVAVAIVGARTFQAAAGATPTAVTSHPAAPPSTERRGAGSAGAVTSTPSQAAAGAGAGAAMASSGTEVVVHVVGQVARPGVVRLPPGSRLLDAVSAAGGATRRADLTRVNLARVAVDGEQLVVAAVGEQVIGAPGPPTGSSPVPSPSSSQRLDLNTADAAALEQLPGVGPVLAGRIVQWRTEHGRFSSVDELTEVSGIGEKLLARLVELVRV